MRSRKNLVLVISILASFVAFLDGSVVNVALPAIARDLGGGLAAQQWVVDGYLLTLGSLILVAGSLSDLFGRKKVLVTGLAGFLITSVLCAIAPNSTFLIVSRMLQGVAGALLVPSSLAIIISTFKGREQGRAIGSWTAWTGIAFVIGPLLGGYLVDAVSWRLVFWINILPIAVTLGLLRLLDLAETPPEHAQVDVLGTLLCALGLGGTVYAFIEQPYYKWGSAMVYAPLVAGLVLFCGFLLYEKRAENPMLPFALFRIRNFVVGNLATILIYAGLSVATFIIVLFLQMVMKYSALQAGMALLPVTLLMFVLSPRFGALAGKYGPRLFMALGPVVAAAGFASFLRVHDVMNYWTQLFPGIVLFGMGLSMTVAPLTSAVLGDIDSRSAGAGSAVNNAIARIAGLVAIALVGLVIGGHAFDTGLVTHGVHAFHKGALGMAVLLFAGGVISAIGIQNARNLKAQ